MAENQMTETQKETQLSNEIVKLKTVLESKITESIEAVPNDLNRQRFVMNCMAVVKGDTKKWEGIGLNKIAEVFMKGAFLGLDFFNGECYAIPYGKSVNFQTDYKGEIKLAKKYSRNPIKEIYAKVVREGDFFEEKIEDGRQSVTFKPVSFSNNSMIGAFAVVLFRDGSMLYETMSKEEIEAVRAGFSKAANSPAWTKTPGEMYKKTVLRRLLKLIDIDFENANQYVAFQDGGDFDENKVVADVEGTEVQDPFENQAGKQEPEKKSPNQIGGLELEEI